VKKETLSLWQGSSLLNKIYPGNDEKVKKRIKKHILDTLIIET
jgi:hypothetical protein